MTDNDWALPGSVAWHSLLLVEFKSPRQCCNVNVLLSVAQISATWSLTSHSCFCCSISSIEHLLHSCLPQKKKDLLYGSQHACSSCHCCKRQTCVNQLCHSALPPHRFVLEFTNNVPPSCWDISPLRVFDQCHTKDSRKIFPSTHSGAHAPSRHYVLRVFSLVGP